MKMDLSERESSLTRRVDELRHDLAQRDTAVLAAKSGTNLVIGGLELMMWETAVLVTLPDFIAYNRETGQMLDPLTQGQIAYYLHTSDGTLTAGEWIAFTELQNGRFYTQAFQGYTGQKLAQHFGNDMKWFRKTAVAIGGKSVPFADIAFQFQAFPHVALLVAGWQGDEDFAPSYTILFDAHTNHHLPTDGCAIIGSMVTERLLSKSSF